MFTRTRFCVLAVALAAAPCSHAAAQTTAPAPADDLQKALAELSADDYQKREDAVKALQASMAGDVRRLVVVQESLTRVQVNLARQLQALSMGNSDMEAQARTAGLVEFNEGLCAWAIDALALPDGQRQAMLDWGFSPGVTPVLARAYSRRPQVRAAAVKELAALEGPQVAGVLAKLIASPDRDVSIAAMDAVYDLPPDDAALDALWDKSAGVMLQQMGRMNQPMDGVRQVMFRGRPVMVQPMERMYGMNFQDADLATEVLIHQKSRRTAARLSKTLRELSDQPMNQNEYYRLQFLLPNYGGPGQNMARLIEAFKPPEGTAMYMKYLTGNQNGMMQNGGQEATINAKHYRGGMGAQLLMVLCTLTKQDPVTYGVARLPEWGGQPAIEGGVKEEQEAVKKMTEWWKVHEKDFSATQPATRPAAGG